MVETDSDKNYHKNGGNLQKGKEKALTINKVSLQGCCLKPLPASYSSAHFEFCHFPRGFMVAVDKLCIMTNYVVEKVTL